MMHHRTLTQARWAALPTSAQLLHVGAELKRLRHWLAAGHTGAATASVERALELLDLTVQAAPPGLRRRELCRAREVLRGVPAAPHPAADADTLRRTLVGDL